MQKYRLIKKYPGSPKIGTISWREKNKTLFQHAKGVFSFITEDPEYVDFPEYWEKYVEKDYEILSFYALNINGLGTTVDDTYIWLRDKTTVQNKWSRLGYMTSPYTYDEMLKHPNYAIHSIKRLSDGVIFTVGDKVDFHSLHHYTNYKIDAIRFGFRDSNKIYFDLSKNRGDDTYAGLALEYAELTKKFLFTTVDGVDIFVGDKYWFVYSWITKEATAHDAIYHDLPKYYWSTKKAAEEYILFNKPCLSLEDVKKLDPNNYAWGKLVGLVKSKI